MALFKKIDGVKADHTMDLLGCSPEFFKRHIESQFQEGMSWENQGKGGWHLDHIIPCDYFDLSDPEQQKICFNYKNLQPLWERDNLSKSNKLPPNFQETYFRIKKELGL